MHYVVTEIVDGALSAECEAANHDAAILLAEGWCKFWGATKSPQAEIYITEHSCDTAIDEECMCVQYLTDHKPYWRNYDG